MSLKIAESKLKMAPASEDFMGKDGLGRQRLKTNGAKLTKLNVEGLSTYTLYTTVARGEEEVEYKFLVQNDGTNTARSPEGVFENVTIPSIESPTQLSLALKLKDGLSNDPGFRLDIL